MNRQELARLSLEELADRMAGVGDGSPADHVLKTEFLLRQTLLQQDAASATRKAANAAIETAEYTRRNARYMLWSVIVLAASSVVMLLLTLAFVGRV